jgi:hypothetical protein
VKLRDRDFGHSRLTLHARMAAVVGAQRALAAREEGSLPALRQSLIDLAALAEGLAEQLPPPTA